MLRNWAFLVWYLFPRVFDHWLRMSLGNAWPNPIQKRWLHVLVHNNIILIYGTLRRMRWTLWDVQVPACVTQWILICWNTVPPVVWNVMYRPVTYDYAGGNISHQCHLRLGLINNLPSYYVVLLDSVGFNHQFTTCSNQFIFFCQWITVLLLQPLLRCHSIQIPFEVEIQTFTIKNEIIIMLHH